MPPISVAVAPAKRGFGALSRLVTAAAVGSVCVAMVRDASAAAAGSARPWAAAGSGAGSKPHIISILQDDLGYADSGIHNEAAAAWSGNITALAKEGVVLTNHYTHWHCSPTRRSFLTGRLPIHHGEQLSGDDTDDIDLRMTWVSGKLAQAGYSCHWFGKWHTGFKSMNHLGHRNGFKTAVGSFQTGGAYSGPGHDMRWQDEHPIWNDAQFTDKPPFCARAAASAPEPALTAGPQCDPSAWHNGSDMQSGTLMRFSNASTAGACCAEAGATPGCTHWVFQETGNPGQHCHIKSGQARVTKTGVAGAACGAVNAPPGPGPSPSPPGPPSPAACTNEYSTDLWGQLAVQAAEEHDVSADGQLHIHLCFEAVHTPYDKAPGDPTGNVYRGMLWRADLYIGQLVNTLKAKGMYDNTLIVYSADNGGVVAGINYPLRGEKHSNWEGGMRTAAFVSGGFLPASVRGTTNGVNMHIVDWYATFSVLAGVSPADDPPAPPANVNTHEDQEAAAAGVRNVYGEDSFPPVDGVNLWPMLTNPSAYAIDAAHAHLVLSKEVLVAGRWKLLVSQPHFKSQNNGWKSLNGTWRQPNASETVPCMKQDLDPSVSPLPATAAPGLLPCLFDLRADPGEHNNVAAANPDVVSQLWAALNSSVAYQRDCSGWSYRGTGGAVPGPAQPGENATSCSPASRLGMCNPSCANAHWAAYGRADGPDCDVPACNSTVA